MYFSLTVTDEYLFGRDGDAVSINPTIHVPKNAVLPCTRTGKLFPAWEETANFSVTSLYLSTMKPSSRIGEGELGSETDTHAHLFLNSPHRHPELMFKQLSVSSVKLMHKINHHKGLFVCLTKID